MDNLYRIADPKLAWMTYHPHQNSDIEELNCLQLHLDKKHRKEVELLRYSLSSEYQENLMKMKMDLSDKYTSEIEQLKRKHCLGLEQLRAKISEEHLREIAKLRLQSAQDAARQVETEVAERLLGLENEYKTKLNDLQTKMLSISSQQEEIEKLRKENAELKEINILQEMHLKEEFEQIKFKLIEAHTAELIRNEEKMQELEHLHKTKAEEWKLEQEDLNIKNEEKLSLLHKDLENKAECEKQALQKQFEFQKAEMTWLQDQQAARIGELEKSLKEQQNNVRQLEDSLANAQKTLSLYDSGLTASKAHMAEELEKAKHVLQEEYSVKLKNAENRFMEEGKAMTKNIMAEHEIFLQELKVKHTAELELQNKELQHKQEEQILSVTLNLQTKHQAEIEALKSALETKQQAWLATYVDDIQNDHKAQIAELEAKHLSELNTLESTYLSEIQLLRDEQKQALEDLQVNLRKQLIQKDRTSQMLLAKELDGMKRKHAEDLQVCQDNLKIELATVHIEKLKTMAEELEEAHKEDLRVAVEQQRRLLEDEHHEALEVLREEILQLKEQHRNTIQELDNLHTLEVKKEKEKWQQLQKDMEQLSADKQQKCSAAWQQEEREKLQESYQQALKLLLKMVKATKDSEDLICKEIGLCPDDSFASGDSGESQNMSGEIVLAKKIAPMEKWSMKKSSIVGQEEVLALILPEDSFDSLVPDEISDLSEHLCESIFENPDLVFANEERINKICQSLHVAVKKLLDLVAESTKQLEEMHNIHLHEEEEFTRKNLEACQVVNEHHELVDCLNEESKVKNQLELELHKTRDESITEEENEEWEHELMEEDASDAEYDPSDKEEDKVINADRLFQSLMEGYLAERHALQESLKLKEESECRLVLELETLKAELQELNQKFGRSMEDQKLLMSQNKILAANIGEQDVDLIKEIEHLAKIKLEVQCQAEKDCSTLNAQMKVLEMELEEQLNKNQNLTKMSLEVTDLRQQVQFLERQLKNQRDFMDKQAIEREHERDEFQEEIQKLEMELKLTAKFQASGQSSLVDSLYSEIKEKTEDLNRLFLEKEHMQKDLAVQNEQIKKLEAQTRELEHKNKEEANKTNQLTQELQKMKKMEAELKEDKEALQQQNHNNLIQISALHSKLDEAKHKMLTGWNSNHVLNEQLKVQEELISKTREENVAKIIMPSQNSDDSELVVLQFLKSLLEEKNQETDHLNEQIVRLQCKIENSKENEILKNQEREIQDLKSIIEHLHDDKEQLLKNKIEETEQLQKVIEKLQKELACLAPLCQEAGNSQNNLNSFAVVEQKDIQNKMKSHLPNHQMNGGKDDNCISLTSNQNKIQDQLEIVLDDTEALQKLLEEKEFQFKAEIKILEQNLKNVQESSLQHFTKLTALHLQYKELEEEHKCLQESLLQRDMERTRFTNCIQELEDKLSEKETNLLQRELQLQRMSEEKSEQAIELQQIKEKFMRLDSEHHSLAQTLHDKEAAYQREVSEFQVTLAELKLEIENKMEELEVLKSERDLFYSQLKSDMEKDQDDDGGEMNLNKLVPDLGDFVSYKEVGEEEEEKEPSNKLLSSPGFSYENKLEKDIAVSNLNAPNESLNLQDKYLQSIICTEEGKIINDKKEKDLQPAFQQLCQLSHLSQSTQFIQKIPESFQSMVLDKTSWDSPEILRKQNSLELQPGLPLTPFSDVDSTTIGSEGLSSENSVIQQDTHGLLELPVSNSNGSEEIGTSLFLQAITFPGSTFSVTEYDDPQENISVSD
ncbi:hypothetical protein JD844_023379 [Phrynosoma platyrhinos]|uniref:Pericentrin n=1 Tax=Phrynosoma platyrhinos TaxID=52577 RepID=A0ABQ7SXH7_PHRPL|nr:hypothetical protein JD844_023379 [Phrynosoma platyrhinos]